MPRPKVSTSNTVIYVWDWREAMTLAAQIARERNFRPYVVPVNFSGTPDHPVRGWVYFIINPNKE